jgi:CheY-like chemotaxis protein
MDLRIMVVEDSETTRRIIRAILETREWRICGEAKNGQEAIRQFRKLRPDVVILDFTMPDLSGIDVAARLSKIDPLVPLILFTISEVEQLHDAASGAGIYAVVSKARAWDLIGTIESAIAHLSDLGQPIQSLIDGPGMKAKRHQPRKTLHEDVAASCCDRYRKSARKRGRFALPERDIRTQQNYFRARRRARKASDQTSM